ncbi:unnamed protein product [Brugia pahangi]|uniref:Bm2343 n=3 Tax=Brugia TaxID=6278 RepID=A0A0H5SD75_BRUMA|nr:Bm2343 [Brugia malayi]VDN83677.1 unnamed protein product [Brugia pahangi]VDO27440.1 unnamed protein product [Brugia timori]
MTEMFRQCGIMFLVTVHVYVIEASPCRCSSCQTSGVSCSKPVVCPTPVSCPLQTCPVPSPCPQPPPCPPCLNTVIQQPVLVTYRVIVPVVRKIPIIENTCCSTCAIPCIARKKRELLAEDELLINNSTKLPVNPVCNSKSLQEIMSENISTTAAESQRLIQKVSETQLGGHFNVLCSNSDLSYSVLTTSSFCQYQKDNIICYAFKMP